MIGIQLFIFSSKTNCDQYVKTEYPAMFYWKGAGSAF